MNGSGSPSVSPPTALAAVATATAPATGGAAPALTATAATLTAAEREAVTRLFDPSTPDGLDELNALTEAQCAYYVECVNAKTLDALLRKAQRQQQLSVSASSSASAALKMAEAPVTITFRNLYFEKNGRMRLQGVSGFLKPQQMVCVIGGPDAGITSLLLVLSGRQRGGRVTGELHVNGAPPSDAMRRAVGFIPKDNAAFPTLTVLETLEFSARLRLPATLSDRLKRLRAATALKLLGLRDVRDSLVGNSTTVRGISGGEARRLSIGVEMVAGHSAIIADSPTNGLDSASAFDVLAQYRMLCRYGSRSLMCSLVAPSPQLLELFDHVLVMSKGVCAYFGPINGVVSYLFGIGFRMPNSTAPAHGPDPGSGSSADRSADDSSSSGSSNLSTNTALPAFLEELSVAPERFYCGPVPPLSATSTATTTRPPHTGASVTRGVVDITDAGTAGANGNGYRSESRPQSQPQQQRQLQLTEAQAAAMAKVEEEEEWVNGPAHRLGRIELDRRTGLPVVVGLDTIADADIAAADDTVAGANGAAGAAGAAHATRACRTAAVITIANPRTGPVPAPVPAIVPNASACAGGTGSVRLSPMELTTVSGDGKDGPHAQGASPCVGLSLSVHPTTVAGPGSRTDTANTTSTTGGTGSNGKRIGTKTNTDGKSLSHNDAVTHLLRAFRRSAEYEALGSELWALEPTPAYVDVAIPAVRERKYNASFALQLQLCVMRQALMLWRSAGTTIGLLVRTAIIATLVGSLFWQLNTEQKDARTRFGLFFFMLSFNTMGAVQALPALMDQRAVYYAQTDAGFYHGSAFYVAYVLMELPVSALGTFVFSVILYGMCGLQGGIASDEFAYAFALLLCVNVVSKSWCLFMAAVCPNQAIAQGITPITMLLFSMFSGYMVPYDSIPIGWQWMYHVSFFTYALRGICQNELLTKTFTCAANELLAAPGASATASRVCPIHNGIDALKQYNMVPAMHMNGTYDADEKWLMLRNVVMFVIAFNAAACTALLYLNYWNSDSSLVGSVEGTSAATAAADDFDVQQNRALKRKRITIARSGDGALGECLTVRVDADDLAGGSDQTDADCDTGSNGDSARIGTGPGTGIGIAIPSIAPVASLVPVNLAFCDLSYAVPSSGDGAGKDSRAMKALLKHTFGYCKAGTMTALMGPSGAGKTTLLDVLAAKKTAGVVTGSVLINGRSRDSTFSLIAGYCEQFDSLDESATVRESLTFSARLRLPEQARRTEHDITQCVERVLNTLGLREYADVIIGSAVNGGGLSPELRKKTAIGVELVMQPRVLFLDEPTTGLDAPGAIAVIDAVRRLATHQCMTVVCTLHQPSQELMRRFDTLLLMKRGGEVAYCGPLTRVSQHFEAIGLGACSADHNIADYAVAAAAGGPRKLDTAQLFLASAAYIDVRNKLRALGCDCEGPSPGAAAVTADVKIDGAAHAHTLPSASFGSVRVVKGEVQSEWLAQCSCLAVRFMRATLRDRVTLRSRVGSSVFIALLLGTLYFRIGHGQLDAANRISLVFLSTLFPCFSAAMCLPVVIGARATYFRERASRMYTPSAYYAARTVAEQPFICVEGLLFGTLLYWLSGLRDDDGGMHFALYLAMYVVMRNTGFAFAEFAASLLSEAQDVTAFHAVLMTLFMLFTGFLVPKSGIPAGWIWMYYWSPFRWAISFMSHNELAGQVFNCNGGGALGPLPLFNATDQTDALQSACASQPYTNGTCYAYVCPVTSGDVMLAQFGMSDDDMGVFFGVCVAMMMAYRTLTFVCLKYINHVKR